MPRIKTNSTIKRNEDWTILFFTSVSFIYNKRNNTDMQQLASCFF